MEMGDKRWRRTENAVEESEGRELCWRREESVAVEEKIVPRCGERKKEEIWISLILMQRLNRYPRPKLLSYNSPCNPWRVLFTQVYFQSLEEILKHSEDSAPLLSILQKTVFHPLCLKYPPSVKYRRSFLLELIKKHESTPAEPLDLLYEALGNVFNTEETTQCYKNYFLPSGDAITLCENVAIISRGTTGLVTWDAGLYLAEWALENSDIFRNRRILELGSGIGFTGIAICKACHPRAYIFSDHHQGVLQQLSENIQLNGVNLTESCSCHAEENPNSRNGLGRAGSCEASVRELDWNLITKEELTELQADVVIAADVVYDPELSQHLVGVLQKLSSGKRSEGTPEVYIAFSIRNPDTYCYFQMELDKVEIEWQVVPTSWKNLFPYDQHANIIILRLFL